MTPAEAKHYLETKKKDKYGGFGGTRNTHAKLGVSPRGYSYDQSMTKTAGASVADFDLAITELLNKIVTYLENHNNMALSALFNIQTSRVNNT